MAAFINAFVCVIPNNCFLFLVNYLATEYQIYVSDITNVALWRPTFQSGAKTGRGSSLAVDGNTDTNMSVSGTCSTTGRSEHPWWAVDLGDTFKLTLVDISQPAPYCKWTKYVYYDSLGTKGTYYLYRDKEHVM